MIDPISDLMPAGAHAPAAAAPAGWDGAAAAGETFLEALAHAERPETGSEARGSDPTQDASGRRQQEAEPVHDAGEADAAASPAEAEASTTPPAAPADSTGTAAPAAAQHQPAAGPRGGSPPAPAALPLVTTGDPAAASTPPAGPSARAAVEPCPGGAAQPLPQPQPAPAGAPVASAASGPAPDPARTDAAAAGDSAPPTPSAPALVERPSPPPQAAGLPRGGAEGSTEKPAGGGLPAEGTPPAEPDRLPAEAARFLAEHGHSAPPRLRPGRQHATGREAPGCRGAFGGDEAASGSGKDASPDPVVSAAGSGAPQGESTTQFGQQAGLRSGTRAPAAEPGCAPAAAAAAPGAKPAASASALAAAPADAPALRPFGGASASAPAPAAPVPVQSILSQVRLQARPGVRELQIRLEPPELGTLKLTFQLRGDALRVSVLATRQDVVSALRNDLSSFAETLREAGIDLDALDIDLDTGADARQADARSLPEQLEAAERGAEPAGDQEPQPAAAPGRHSGLVDITV